MCHAVDSVGWEEVKKLSTDARELLQRLGTEVGRDMFGNDFWVNQAILRAKEHDKVVISDVRYINEAEAVRGQGGLVFRINKNNVSEVNSHESEKNLNDYEFDYIINNDSTKEDLYRGVDSFFISESL